jgi:vacuolar-type H+-ATPase subunit H
MRATEFVTLSKLEEISRRDLLKGAGATAIASLLPKVAGAQIQLPIQVRGISDPNARYFITGLKMSNNGKYVLVSSRREGRSGISTTVRLIDCENSRWTYVEDNGTRINPPYRWGTVDQYDRGSSAAEIMRIACDWYKQQNDAAYEKARSLRRIEKQAERDQQNKQNEIDSAYRQQITDFEKQIIANLKTRLGNILSRAQAKVDLSQFYRFRDGFSSMTTVKISVDDQGTIQSFTVIKPPSDPQYTGPNVGSVVFSNPKFYQGDIPSIPKEIFDLAKNSQNLVNFEIFTIPARDPLDTLGSDIGIRFESNDMKRVIGRR